MLCLLQKLLTSQNRASTQVLETPKGEGMGNGYSVSEPGMIKVKSREHIASTLATTLLLTSFFSSSI